MKEPTSTYHFKILRKDKITPILEHKLLPHPKPNLTPTLFSQFVFQDEDKFVFSQNFKMTCRCWFLRSPFGSLGSSFVLLVLGEIYLRFSLHLLYSINFNLFYSEKYNSNKMTYMKGCALLIELPLPCIFPPYTCAWI